MTDSVTVEQCDRDAANAWWYGKSTAGVDPNEDLAIYLAGYRTASEQRGYDRAIAEVVARMKRIEPDEEAAGCPASWGDFLQILESVAIEAGEHKP